MAKAADEFLQKCAETELLPDVFEFLSSRDGLSERAQLEVLLVDQFQRWKRNQVIPVDQYLDRTPEISDVLKVELLVEEFGYLEQRGIAPTAEAFASRYAGLSSAARQELREALEIQPASGSAGSDPSGSTDSGESASIASPELIGRYQVVRMLGKGAFGKVFLAKDPDLDRSVAVKVPNNKRIRMGGGVEEFLNEARAVAKLDHPNIVPVYDCGITQDDRCFVVSKYVRGKELRAEIRKGVSHREAAQIICQLARALHVAHVAGIVHRDVKPGNVIIDSKRCPHLLDFGLAYQDQNSDEAGGLIGTPAYMSPEQAEGASHRVDGRSDIYSLAIMFYEMLTGHRPCKSEKAEDILAHLKQGEVRPPRQSDDTIPVALEAICLKALSRRISDRYSTAKDMADEIEDWLLETGSADDSTTSRGAIGSPDSQRSFRSSHREPPTQQPAIVRLLTAPATIGVTLCLAALVVILAFTNPPWETPGSNEGATQVSKGEPGSTGSDLTSGTTARSKSNRIAVLGFRNLSDSPENAWLSTGLAELITEDLGKSEQLNLVSCENVSLMKADLDLANSEVLGTSALERIENRLGADWVVLGSYSTEDSDTDQVRLAVTLQKTDDADRKIQFEKTIGRSQWRELVTGASAQVRRALGVPPPNIVGTGQLFPSAPDLNAVEDYFTGIESLRAFNPLAAKASLEKAAIADSESALIPDALAQATQQLGDENAARQFAAKAVELSDSLPKHQQLAIRARHHLLVGETAKAVAEYRSLWELRNGALEERLLLAEAMTRAGQGWKAFDLLDEARRVPQTDSASARIDLASAEAAQSVSEFSRQREFAQSAAGSAQKVGARLLEGLAKLSEGQALRRVGEHQQSVICFDKAVKLLTEHGDKRSAAMAMADWGKALVDHGQLDEAEAKINEGLQLSRQLGNQRLIARLTGQLGEVAIYRGKFADAEKLLSESLESFSQLGDRQGMADMNLTLANVMARTGKPDKAMEMIAAARKAFQSSGDRRGEGRTWGQQGAMLGRQGNVADAQRHFERALELFREVGDRRGIATCLGDLATTNSNLGRLSRAGELYSEALELLRQMNSNRGPAMVMFNLSNLYARTGRFSEAEKLMTESLQRYQDQEKWMNACFVERKLGDIRLQRGSLADAKQTVSDALARSREVGSLAVEAQSLSTLCDISIFEGNLEEARKQILASQTLSRQLKQELGVAACDLTLARLSLRDGNLDDAERFFQKAESTIIAGKPEFKSLVLFFQCRLESAQEKRSAAEATLAKAELAVTENPTEDVGITLRSRLERARALAAVDRVDEAAAEFKAVAEQAREYGWPALEMECQTVHMEALDAAEMPVAATEVENLHRLALERGFLDFANRAENLQH